MRGTVVCLAAALALSAAAAAAEEGPDRARELFLAGAEAFEAERYEAALEAFEASYELNPVTSVLYNVAMCQRALFRYGDSMASFERYLEAARDRLSEARRAEVLELLEDMEGRVATVDLRVEPEWAEVLVDGAVVAPSRRQGLRLLPGLHVVEARAEEREPARREVELSGGEVAVVALVLEPEDAGPEDAGPENPDPDAGGRDRGVHRQWWFWTVLVGAAALVGGAIGLGVAFGSPAGLGPGDWQVELP